MLGQEKGNLTLKVARRSDGYAIEIVEPPGLSEHDISTGHLPSELESTAARLRGDDHVLFRLYTYPTEGKELGRYAVELLEAPDYAR